MKTKARFKTPWKRRLLLAGAVLVVLLGAVYFALTSTAFVRGFVLPRVGQLLGAEITVAGTAIRPFSRAEFRQLKVQVAGQEALLEIGELRARYSLFDILRGRIRIDEATVTGLKLHLVETDDGKNNLPALLQPQPAATKPAAPSKVNLTPRLEIKKVSITDASLKRTTAAKSGRQETMTVSEFKLNIDRIENGAPGKVTLTSTLRLDQRATPGASNEFLVAKSSSELAFTLSPELIPQSVRGGSRHEVTDAAGAFRDLTGLAARVDVDYATNELAKFSVVFDQRAARLGEIKASGPLNLGKKEGRIAFEVSAINRQVLNLLGAQLGVDFQQTSLGASGLVSLTQGGKAVTAEGKVQGRRVSVSRPGAGATPPLDLDATYEFQANLAAEKVTLQKLQLTGRQGATELVSGKLDYPMEVSWAKNSANSFTKSTLTLALKQFDLAAWRALHGRTNLAGMVEATLAMTAAPGKDRLQLTLDAALRNLASDLTRQSELMAKLSAAYAVKNGAHLVTGKGSVVNATGAAADLFPAGFAAALDFEASSTPEELALRRFTATITHGNVPGGRVEAAGKFLQQLSQGEFTLKLDNLNQHALGPFLAGALAPNRLATATLNGSTVVRLDTKGSTEVEANFALASLTVARTDGQRGAIPLGASLKLSAASGNGVHELKRALLAITPAGRAKNELQANARFDLRAAKAEPSRLSVTAESLDVTAWWDAFAPSAAKTGAPESTPVIAPAKPRAEPEPAALPVKQFKADLNVGRLYARQIDVSNFVATAQLADGLLAVKPLQCSLNGAPVKALLDMNLGVRGWIYDLDLGLERVPLQPLMDSVSPASAGTFRGDLTLNTQLKGAGITDEALRQNLKGETTLSLTNSSIQLAQGWKQGVLKVVATLLRVPEIAEAPIAWATVNVRMGGGQIELPGARVGSEVMIATLAGKIPMAPVLTNSPLHLPVKLELSRALAQQARLTVGGPTNEPFAALPDFLTITGTLGKPESKTDKLALGGVLLQSVAGIPGLAGEKAGTLLQGLGGLLTGQPASTNTSGTNAAGTNAPAKFNPFDLLKRKP